MIQGVIPQDFLFIKIWDDLQGYILSPFHKKLTNGEVAERYIVRRQWHSTGIKGCSKHAWYTW
ncbi:MAG TPA: hypothetical protein VGN00_14150 [Puia sp.]